MKLIIILGVLAASLGSLALSQPSTYVVRVPKPAKPDEQPERLQARAPAKVLTALVGDLQRWEDWATWLDDRQMTLKPTDAAHATFESPAFGRGSIEVTGRTDTTVDVAVRWDEPAGRSERLRFEFIPNGPATLITLEAQGDLTFSDKVSAAVIDVERLKRPELEKALNELVFQAQSAVEQTVADTPVPEAAPEPGPGDGSK